MPTKWFKIKLMRRHVIWLNISKLLNDLELAYITLIRKTIQLWIFLNNLIFYFSSRATRWKKTQTRREKKADTRKFLNQRPYLINNIKFAHICIILSSNFIDIHTQHSLKNLHENLLASSCCCFFSSSSRTACPDKIPDNDLKHI